MCLEMGIPKGIAKKIINFNINDDYFIARFKITAINKKQQNPFIGVKSKDGLDYMFASKSDAENWSKIINGHYSQPFFSVDAIAVSPTANIFDSEGNQIAPNDIFVADLGESFIFVPDSKAKIYDDVYVFLIVLLIVCRKTWRIVLYTFGSKSSFNS